MKVLQLKVRRFGMFIETSGECAVYLNKEASCVTDTSYNLGQTLRQCCNIHIFMSFLGSLLKQCILLENILAVLPSPHPIQSGNWIHAFYIVCGVRLRGWTCVNWKTPKKCGSVFLSMIVAIWRRRSRNV